MFTHLHNHTEYSLLDGCSKIKDCVKRAKDIGQNALAITDHGVAYGLVEFYNECKAQGIKPILGCEVYVSPGSRFDKAAEKGIEKKYFHLILLIKNEIGYENFCKLISRSNTEGFYYKPRIDFELLEMFHEGLVCLSACVAGEIPQMILANRDRKEITEKIMQYKNLFGDDFYLEIMDHGLAEEGIVKQELYKYSKELGIKIVATNDCHYVLSEDAEAHDWLICMQMQKKIDDESRMRYEGDYSIKTEEEMYEIFKAMPEALSNTQEIVDKCNFDFKFAHGAKDYRMPKVIIPKEYGDDYFKYMSDEAYKGLNERYPVGHKYREEALERIQYELSVIKQMGFAEYFLDTRKTILWARANGILVGPGRGSGAGSVMNYCLGITDIDPIKYGLIFERFLNPERVSMPDIDVDYNEAHKEEVLNFEAESNGTECFTKIQTFGTMLAKGVIKDCLRTADYPVSMGNDFSKMIGDFSTLQEAYDANPEISEYIENNNLQKVWNIALKLEGLKKSAGTHACGHIPTPIPAEELFPCSVDKNTGYLICQYNMVEAEHLGNLKKDLLMLRNLEIITVAAKEIKRRRGIDIPLWNEEVFTNKKMFELISSGQTTGMFQIESDGMKSLMKKLKPTCDEDIIAGISLYRPGSMSEVDKFIENKHHPENIEYDTPQMEEVLKNTYGIMVYQEQMMQASQVCAGFSMAEADMLRKAAGKKKMEIMVEYRDYFIHGNKEKGIPGCVANGISEETAGIIFDKMQEFAKYAFNKSHAAAYAAITMQTAYLKANYPLEFMVGLLSSVVDNTKKLVPYMAECKRMGIKILPPDLNESDILFKTEGNDIRFALLALKGVGKEDLATLIDERNANGKYLDITDILTRTSKDTVFGKGLFFPLIKAGALDFMGYSRLSLINNVENIIKCYKKSVKDQIAGQMSLFDFGEAKEKNDYISDLGEAPKKQLWAWEKESTGTYITGHPLEDYTFLIKKHIKHVCSELEKPQDEEEVIANTPMDGEDTAIAGMIISVKRIFTKKDQKAMAFLTIEDMTGTAEVVVFPKKYEMYKNLLAEDNKVLIKGNISDNGEKLSVLADEICNLDSLRSNLWVKFATKEERDLKIEALRKIAAVNEGMNNFIVYTEETGQKEMVSDSINIDGCLAEVSKMFDKAKVSFN